MRVCACARACACCLQGVFSTFLADAPDGTMAIPHNSFVKLYLVLPSKECVYRTPAWIRYAVFVESSREYCGKFWCPPEAEKHTWRHPRPHLQLQSGNYAPNFGVGCIDAASAAGRASASADGGGGGGGGGSGGAAAAAGGAAGGVGGSAAPAATGPKPPTAEPDQPIFSKALRIYEAHIGMATKELRVGTYAEFGRDVLPRIKALGYNCVQVRAASRGAVICVGCASCRWTFVTRLRAGRCACAADGDHGARVLRQLWLPCDQLFCGIQSLRHSGGAEAVGGPGARHGVACHHGRRAQSRIQERECTWCACASCMSIVRMCVRRTFD
jgi:hypothetical protein